MYKFFNDYKEYFLLVFLLVISLILLTQNNDPRIRKVRTVSFGTFAYVNSFFHSIGGIFSDDSELIKAEKLNAELMLKVNLLREYGLENFELKELLNYSDKTNFPLETVKVISRLTSRTEGNMIINKGAKDSLTSGMAVINNEGLVGIVTDVSNSFSMVRTINNSDLKITVTDQRSGVNAIAGWDGEKMLLRNVPTTYDIEPGDRIITSELSTVYPPAIPVGIVSEKESNISGLLGNVIVKPFAHADKAEYLFVIKIVPSREIDSLEMNLFIEKK